MSANVQKPQPSYCVIIPAYNESAGIIPVIEKVRKIAETVVVVDDGSTDDTSEKAKSAGAVVIRHENNLGKGASLISGFKYGSEHKYDLVITLDADGQHDPEEIPRFLDAYQRTRIPVLVGNRMWNTAGMPLLRYWTNLGMSRLLCRIMKQYLPDTQCGFRLYRCDILNYAPTGSQRFAMESEILLQLALRGFRMDSIRITTIYRGEKSRINPIMDTIRFLIMLVHFAHERKMRRTPPTA
ncbi:MAG TPA: glycosyltransferase family 2 protein [Kiritimatiellia bacterium]|nr:glycosyltransferase family 2 protein [Kiritimatiellia bacterium]